MLGIHGEHVIGVQPIKSRRRLPPQRTRRGRQGVRGRELPGPDGRRPRSGGGGGGGGGGGLVRAIEPFVHGGDIRSGPHRDVRAHPRRVAVLLPPRAPPPTVIATAVAVGGGGVRGRRQDWRTRRRSSACCTTGMATTAKTTVMW